MKFAIFDMATGRIDRIIGCPGSEVEMNLGPTEDALAVSTETDTSHYVKNRKLVAFPPKASATAAWDFQNGAWKTDAQAAAAAARLQRERLLDKADKKVDAMQDDDNKTGEKAWRQYRTALRKITEQPGYPTSITWPEPPQ
ncbi:MAG: Phage tail assembly chaperone protein [Variovorax sp.]|nr:Phage tail assembly chaperone protein [Variovorax sp.]